MKGKARDMLGYLHDRMVCPSRKLAFPREALLMKVDFPAPVTPSTAIKVRGGCEVIFAVLSTELRERMRRKCRKQSLMVDGTGKSHRSKRNTRIFEE